MPQANLNANFEKFVAHVSKHGFDVGRDIFFTAAPGMILPVFKDFLNPDERISINVDDYIQTQTLAKPAQLKVRQKVDFFFVPATMILTTFGNALFQTNDFLSSLVNLQGASNVVYLPKVYLPSFDSSNINRPWYIGDYGETTPFDSLAKGNFRLAMHLGYNPFALIRDLYQQEADRQVFATPFDYNPSLFPCWYAVYQAIYYNYYRNDDWEERKVKAYNLDFLYDNDDVQDNPLNDLWKLRYHQRVGDYFTSVKRSPVMSTINLVDSDTDGSSINVLRTINNYLATGADTEIYPSDIDGVDNIPNSDKYFGGVFANDASFGVNTNSLRSLFAVEKYLRITGRAAKNYDSQVLAHFGVNVPRDIKHELTYIGGFDGYVGARSVAATSSTPSTDTSLGTELGELGAYGTGELNGRNLRFTAPCHGFVMGVYYCTPEVSYPLGMLPDKRSYISDRLDFFFPEYDKLGKQPLFAYECYPLWARDGRSAKTLFESDYPLNTADASNIVGWQYRYEQWKRQYNVHSLAFYRPYTWEQSFNDWSSWVVGKNPFELFAEDGSVNYASLLTTPKDLDRVFVVHHKTSASFDDFASPWLLFQTDPLMIAMRVDAKKTSFMSPTGEPDLD